MNELYPHLEMPVPATDDPIMRPALSLEGPSSDTAEHTVRWGDGHTTTWSPDGEGGFIAQFGVFDALIDEGGGAYTVRKKNLTTYRFESGRLVSVADRNGNTIALNYTDGNLTRFTDTAGRVFTLTYDTSNKALLLMNTWV